MKPDYVFIVGCNRTGTSLVRQILNKSVQMCLCSETHFLRRLSRVGVTRPFGGFGDLALEANVQRLVNYIYADHRVLKISYWQWLKRNCAREEFTRRVLATDRSDRALFQTMMQVYAETLKPAQAELILGEKTPTHLYFVPTLLEWFPNARVVHMMRDPRAIIVSKLKKVNRKSSRDGIFKPLGEVPQRVLAPLADPVEVVHTSTAWMDAARLHDQYARRYADQYRLLRFEDLIAEPEANIKQLCAFLEVEYEPAMLGEIHVVASSFHSQHKSARGIDVQALDRWKSYSNPLVNAGFAILGRAQLERFGYVP